MSQKWMKGDLRERKPFRRRDQAHLPKVEFLEERSLLSGGITGLEEPQNVCGEPIAQVKNNEPLDRVQKRGYHTSGFAVEYGSPASASSQCAILPSDSETTEDETSRVTGDYDGDGLADLASYLFDETRGVGIFQIDLSSGDSRVEEITGLSRNDIPVEGDFDGDGIADLAVVQRFGNTSQPEATVWVHIRSSDNIRVEFPFGATGSLDQPAPGDFDGDGITDIATFRANSDLHPGAAEWFILPSKSDNAFSVVFGAAGQTDRPAVADYDRDGLADIATIRPVSDLNPNAADWFILPSEPNKPNYATTDDAFNVTFGAADNADQPAVADYNGDGRDDITAFRSQSDLALGNAQFFTLPSSGDAPNVGSGFSHVFGEAGTIAAISDYTGNTLPDLVVYDQETSVWTIGDAVGNVVDSRVFNPSGLPAVPVLAPLLFRLDFTDNLPSTPDPSTPDPLDPAPPTPTDPVVEIVPRPLTEMTGLYKGTDPGLYGGGTNTPPPSQAIAASGAAAQIQPLDRAGMPSPRGRIGLVSIGPSTTQSEFAAFQHLLSADPRVASDLVTVNGAQSGVVAQSWANTLDPWIVLDQRLASVGVSREQVQVVWIKAGHLYPFRDGEFPQHVGAYANILTSIVQQAKQTFPNLQIAYLTSQLNFSYAEEPVQPEPFAFESAFGVREVIKRQIAGSPTLNADPNLGPVAAPVMLWGPYIWADTTTPRLSDGLQWLPSDFQPDGIHHSAQGNLKVAQLLLDFLVTDPWAQSWFLA